MEPFTPFFEKRPLLKAFFPGRAAEYVRMSTDDQQNSIANQRDAILRYAIAHNLSVVRTYADAGKSGLNIERRNGLMRLLDDIQSGAVDYSTVLVYDVSRWGRFQDADEAAYYEQLCKRAGVTVQYCAEVFPNDHSVTATIIKNIKRAMAGEYSRELSVKTFAGQRRFVAMGFKPGGPPTYGYRRMLVGQNGRPKFVLNRGDRKSLSTDRVVLVPGPAEEIKVVRWIFRAYASGRLSQTQITERLNERGVPSPGKAWHQSIVQRILVNEAYIGNSVWNRKSAKLKSRAVRNSRDLWIRLENAHAPIVDQGLFYATQKVMASRSLPRLSSRELLRKLKEAWKRHGRITQDIINMDPELPHAHSYSTRFGSLLRAYELIGYRPSQRMLTRERNRPITGWHLPKH